MTAMIAKRKESKCIHCHDVKVARLRHLQSLRRFQREMVFTYPTPANLGINVHPEEQNKVQSVKVGSPAARAGIRAGDVLLSADGQRLLTLADFSRVLELTPKENALPLAFRRAGNVMKATLKLTGDWRKTSDPSWRPSLHVAGPSNGFWGRKLNANERRDLLIPADKMAVKVTFIWGSHTRKAGLRVNDVVVSVDGMKKDMGIKQLHAYSMLYKDYGDSIPLVVRRNGKDVELTLRFPAEAPKLE